MRAIIRLVAVGGAVALLGLLLLLALAGEVVAGHMRLASSLAAPWDIPPELVPVFEEAGGAAGVPWFLLAAVASVATDFARHGPDGIPRGDTFGTSIFPIVTPPIGTGGGRGMFLLASTLGDPQDVRAGAEYLAAAFGGVAGQPPPGDAGATRFWTDLVARLPVRIDRVAPGQSIAADIGPGNPIRQFAAGLLTRLGAPPTVANLDAIAAWAAGEGSCARFNPLDTTQPEAGATPFNTLAGGGHVWNYPSSAVGIRATAETLLNGLYDPVVAALQASAGVGAVEAAVTRSPWGTRFFGPVTYAGRPCGQVPGPAEAPALPTIDGPQSVAATIVARAARYQAIWEQQGDGTGPGGYRLPVDRSWYLAHPDWFERPHHDYPAADIPVPTGTAVYAVTGGRVVAADEAGGGTSCGHDVRLLGQDGTVYSYCHGSQVLVASGQQVAPGQVIMRSGWSGDVVPAGPAGAHLHFQIDLAGRPGPVCPQPALAAWATGQQYDIRRLPPAGCVS